MKRRFFSIFAALCLCLTLLPTAALAADPDTGVSVCGTEITHANKGNVFASTPNDGKVSYNSDNHTLTLSGAALECTPPSSGGAAIYIANNGFPVGNTLTIVLEGANTITVKGSNGQYGICSSHPVRIQGGNEGGSLTISFDDSAKTQTYGIYMSEAGKNLTIESGATVTINAGNATGWDDLGMKSYGVQVDGNLTVNGTLNATAGNATNTSSTSSTSSTGAATSYGVWTSGSVTVGAGGRLDAKGGEAKNTNSGFAESYGVKTSGSVTINAGGSLTATGGTATANTRAASSCGIFATDTVTASGTLNATGGETSSPAGANSYGVYATNVNVSGNATVNAGKAESTNSSAFCTGVRANGGNVTVAAGGTLNVNTVAGAGTVTGANGSKSYGVQATDVDVNGTLNVNTGTGAGTVTGANGSDSYGVYATNVNVSGNATVNTAEGAGAVTISSSSSGIVHSYGVYAGSSLTVNAGGSLTAKSGTATAYTAGSATGDSYAYSYGVLVSGSSIAAEIHGTVGATGGSASASNDSASYGLYLDAYYSAATLTVGATGSLTGTGGASAKSCGIYVSNGGGGSTTVTLSGGTMLGQTKAALDAETDVPTGGGSSGGSGTADGTGGSGGGSGESVPSTASLLLAAGGPGTGSPTVSAPTTNNIGIYVDTNMTNADVDIRSGTVTGKGTNCGVYVKGTLKVGVGTVESVTLRAKASTGGTAIYATRTTATEESVVPLLLEVEPHAVSIVEPVDGSLYTQSITDTSSYTSYATVLNGDDPASGVATEAILQRIYVAPVPETPSYTPVIALYPVIVEEAAHGAAESDRAAAAAGTAVTITVVPGAGYRLSGLTAVDYRGRAVELVDCGNGVFTFTMPASKVTVTATFAPMRTFTDVPPGSWYFDAVTWAVGSGITTGMTSTTFEPDLACTRAQVVTFLYRAAKAAGVDVSVGEETNILSYNDALDIPEYAFEAFQWACGAGIVQGDSSGNLLPNASCTRTHIVTFLWRFAQVIGMDVSVGEETNILSYNDIFDVPEYAFEAFQWACGAGIVQGDNGNLLPNASCTRGQIVTMLYRMLGE